MPVGLSRPRERGPVVDLEAHPDLVAVARELEHLGDPDPVLALPVKADVEPVGSGGELVITPLRCEHRMVVRGGRTHEARLRDVHEPRSVVHEDEGAVRLFDLDRVPVERYLPDGAAPRIDADAEDVGADRHHVGRACGDGGGGRGRIGRGERHILRRGDAGGPRGPGAGGGGVGGGTPAARPTRVRQAPRRRRVAHGGGRFAPRARAEVFLPFLPQQEAHHRETDEQDGTQLFDGHGRGSSGRAIGGYRRPDRRAPDRTRRGARDGSARFAGRRATTRGAPRNDGAPRRHTPSSSDGTGSSAR